jgi:metal-responsive CopG/Arc/MetJ family transcriptional regulator
MRIAVSIPDEVLKEIERLARRVGRSRSEIITAALSEYVARHAPDEVTDAINCVIAGVGDAHDAFSATAAHRILAETEW